MTEQEILDFVGRSFSSAWQLELLLVLYQEPSKDWRVDALVSELRANRPVVVQGLATLEAIGFVAAAPERAYRYQPRSPELGVQARELIALYSSKPRAVMRAIFAAPHTRIQIFADAFRMRKD